MPRRATLGAQSFFTNGYSFDSGFVEDGDFQQAFSVTAWNTSSFVGGTEDPVRNAAGQVEFTNNCVLTQSFVVSPNQNMQLRLSFYVYDVINTNGNQVYVNYNNSGVPEQRTPITETGLITAILDHGTASSGTIEFRCVSDPANILVIDKVKVELV